MTSDFYKGYVNTGDLDYKDVFLIPQYSEVTSRSQVSTSVRIGDMKIDVPSSPVRIGYAGRETIEKNGESCRLSTEFEKIGLKERPDVFS